MNGFQRVSLGLDTSGRKCVVTRRMKEALEEVEEKLGVNITITQGAFMGEAGAQASAGTHNGSGVMDLRVWDLPAHVSPWAVQRELRRLGFAAWYRYPPLFDPHIHAIDIGDPNLSWSAKVQVIAYRAGRDGLKGNRRDNSWRPARIKPYVLKKDWLAMASKEDVKDAIREVLHERLVPVVNNEDPRFADPAGKVSVIRAIQGTWRNARGVYMRVNK